MDDNTRRAALDYHRFPQPGKLRIEPTKRMVNQRDLALAYSPGVAAPCLEIAEDPDKAMEYTRAVIWSRSYRMERRCWALDRSAHLPPSR